MLDILKKMAGSCQDMRKLLNDDKSLFSKNDLDGLDASNRKKIEVINQLNKLANELNIKSQRSDMTHPELRNVMSRLKAEVSSCYESIVVNNSIVFSNMQHLKEIWDKLVIQKGSNNTYDQTGSRQK